MKEKDIQVLFGKHNTVIGVFELKLVKGKSMPFDRVEKHQISALLKACNDSLYYKISDMSAGYKPFDCFNLSGVDAYIVLVWYVPRKKKIAYYIHINDYVNHVKKSERKSITEETALKIAKNKLYL